MHGMESFTIISISYSVTDTGPVRVQNNNVTSLHDVLKNGYERMYEYQTGFQSIFNYTTILLTQDLCSSIWVFNLQK
jgi:hypothetical protein